MSVKKIDKDFWNSLYQSNDTGWDIGYPSPALSHYIDQLPDKNISILIPGCGNSYEAQYLLQKGFTNITLIDIAPRLTQALEKKFAPQLGKQLNIITGDFFDLKGQFDLILEQTLLSALPPALRDNYRDKMFELLKPGGRLVGVLFSRVFEEEGPPFGDTKESYERLFAQKFAIKVMAPCYNSIDRRAGAELFINLMRKS
jgi:SAM-dependent methyltransferase